MAVEAASRKPALAFPDQVVALAGDSFQFSKEELLTEAWVVSFFLDVFARFVYVFGLIFCLVKMAFSRGVVFSIGPFKG